MSDIKVTQAEIDLLLNSADVQVRTEFGKCTVVPDEHSKMTSPYIYIDTTGLRSNNPDAPRSCVPWLASQTDMLAEDWEIAEVQHG